MECEGGAEEGLQGGCGGTKGNTRVLRISGGASDGAAVESGFGGDKKLFVAAAALHSHSSGLP